MKYQNHNTFAELQDALDLWLYIEVSAYGPLYKSDKDGERFTLFKEFKNHKGLVEKWVQIYNDTRSSLTVC